MRRFLVVEDNPGDATYLGTTLREWNQANDRGECEVDQVAKLADAIDMVSRHDYQLIFLDTTLPDAGPVDAAAKLRCSAPSTPIIALTLDPDLPDDVLAIGADECLLKGRDWSGLDRIVDHVLERSKLHRSLVDAHRELSVATTEAENGRLHDPTTGLLTRQGLGAQLGDEIQRSRRQGLDLHAVLAYLDPSTSLESALGAEGARTALQSLATEIRKQLRATDSAGHLDKDAFLILLPQSTTAGAHQLARRFQEAVSSSPIEVAGRPPLTLALTVVVSPVPLEAHDLVSVLGNTGFSTLLASRPVSKKVISSVSSAVDPEGVARLLHEQAEFSALAQPIVRLEDGRATGLELLTRTSLHGYRRPADFFGVSETMGVRDQLDLRCLRLCIEAATDTLGEEQLRHVNLYARTLRTPAALEQLSELIGSVSGTWVLEFDASEIAASFDVVPLIRELRSDRILVAAQRVKHNRDCLEALILLQPDFVKTAPSALWEVRAHPGQCTSLSRLVRVANALGATTIVTGIESETDEQLARDAGAELGQGVFLGKPEEPSPTRS